MTKQGTGTFTVTGASTYSGTTTIRAGRLQVGSGSTTGSLGTGAITNNANLAFNRSDNVTVANVLSGSGSLTQSGTGTTTVTGANNYTGATIINAGTLKLGGSTAQPGLSTGLSFNGTNSSSAVVVGNIGARPTQGTISFWMKPTTVSSYQNPFTTGSTGSLNAGIRFEEVSGGTFYAVIGNDAGSYYPVGSTTFTTGLAANAWVQVALTWNSSTSQAVGYLNGVQSFNVTNITNWVTNFSNLQLGIGNGSAFNGTLADVRIYNVQRSQGQIQGDMNQVLTGNETGLIGYWPLNDGTGTTATDKTVSSHNGTLSGGLLPTWTSIQGNGSLSASTVVQIANGATFDLNGKSQTIASLSGAGNVALGSGQLTTGDSASTTYAGIISGTGSFTKIGAGIQTLSGPNIYTGSTTISAGTLNLTSAGTTSATSVTGTGTLKGNGTVAGNLSNNAIVAPGNSPGIITVNGSYTQTSVGALTIEIQGTNATTPDFDQVFVNGTVSLAGTLNISFLNNFIPTNGNTFKIIANDSSDAISGSFTGLTEGEIFTIGNTLFGISYAGGDGNDVVLTALSTTYVVTSTADSGAGSLRQAIIDSNAGPGYDTITFNITGAGVRTISPTTALPTITDAVVINGYTQPGSSANTLTTGSDAVILIELNGSSAGAGANGLTITGGNSLVTGLAINRFLGMGINIRGAAALNNTLQGNFVGLNANGTTAQANGTWGIFVDGSPNTTIGGTTTGERNLISGNSQGGVAVIGSTATVATIEGNWIGTDISGSLDRGNAFSGVYVGTATGFGGVTSTGSASQSVIRNNVISGNNNSGVWIRGIGSNQHQVAGNFIGTDSVGGTAIGNSLFGVLIDSGASNNIIGGVSATDRNVISGNANDGVLITGATTNNNVVIGNYIGTDITGMLDLGNARSGVMIENAVNNTIGGSATASRNVISGNNGEGIRITGGSASGNRVQGNYIGTNATGSLDLGNSSFGVHVIGGADSNFIGTNGDGVGDQYEGNVISGNDTDGIWIGDEGTIITLSPGTWWG